MANNLNTVSEENFGDAEDVLSLSNFPIPGYEYDVASRRASNFSSNRESFEFFPDQFDLDEVNEYRKRDYLCLRTASFHKERDYQFDGGEGREVISSPSESRFSSSDLGRWRSPVQKVNITAITAMSAKSRRRMFMFGPVKFKPEMDVSAIRNRRSRRPPMSIPPMPEESEVVMDGRGGGKGRSGGASSGGDGGLVRPLWCRSHLANALAKSFACGSASMV